MRTVDVKLYTFDELDDDAKERAREWWREHALGYEWWDSTVDYVREVGSSLGIMIDNVYFTGFYSQGDGASFDGFYSYKPGWLEDVGTDEWSSKVREIGSALQKAQRKHFYGLGCSISRNHGAHYYHENTMCFDVTSVSGCAVPVDDKSLVSETLRSFARWIYSRLEEEYGWLMSDEQVDESIMADEYEFLASGEPA